MAKRCSKWCGAGCTEAMYQAAKAQGTKVAQALGAGWKVEVWENMGWHAAVRSSCGRIRVHVPARGGSDYAATLGPPGHTGAALWGEGTTPRRAVNAVIRAGRRQADKAASLVEGLEVENVRR